MSEKVKSDTRKQILKMMNSMSEQYCRLEVYTGMGTAGIPRNPRVSRGYGSECCGNTTGMDLAIVGFPRGWIFFGGDRTE